MSRFELHIAYLQCKFNMMFYVWAAQQHFPTLPAVCPPQLCFGFFLPHFPCPCAHIVTGSLFFSNKSVPKVLAHPPLSSTCLSSSQKSFDSLNGFTFQACAYIFRHSFPPICWTFHPIETQETSRLGHILPTDIYPKEIS